MTFFKSVPPTKGSLARWAAICFVVNVWVWKNAPKYNAWVIALLILGAGLTTYCFATVATQLWLYRKYLKAAALEEEAQAFLYDGIPRGAVRTHKQAREIIVTVKSYRSLQRSTE